MNGALVSSNWDACPEKRVGISVDKIQHHRYGIMWYRHAPLVNPSQTSCQTIGSFVSRVTKKSLIINKLI
ncbi:MAG: hypothetical protein WCP34_07895, partial [Pseudomonadota bacterium]